MITLNQLADNIHEMMYPNTLSLEGEISKRQIKHWVHYHRAKLIADNIDKGILSSSSLYQSLSLTLRNSTRGDVFDHYKAWDDYDNGVTSTAPSAPAADTYLANCPKSNASGKLNGEWITSSSLAADNTGNSQSWLDARSRDQFGREFMKTQVRGDFRNIGIHNFFIPSPLMLKDDNAIKDVLIRRRTYSPDDLATTSLDQGGGFQNNPITVYKKTNNDIHFSNFNKFTDHNKPYYDIGKSSLNRDLNQSEHYISFRGLQTSPNYHENLDTPGNKNLFWAYRAWMHAILADPTNAEMMHGLWYETKSNWDDSKTPYPIPMDYVKDLIERIVQQESSVSLKTMASE